jgi:hypothetical protein
MNPDELLVKEKEFIEQFKCKCIWSALSMMNNCVLDAELYSGFGLQVQEGVFKKMAKKEWKKEVLPKLKSGIQTPTSSVKWHDITEWLTKHVGHELTEELIEELRQLVIPK